MMQACEGDARTQVGKPGRRALDYWRPLNAWWRDYVAQHERRPATSDIDAWYLSHADAVWGEDKPTAREARQHANCLRPVEQVKAYFRKYRKRKAGSGDGSGDNSGSMQQEDFDAPEPKQPRGQLLHAMQQATPAYAAAMHGVASDLLGPAIASLNTGYLTKQQLTSLPLMNGTSLSPEGMRSLRHAAAAALGSMAQPALATCSFPSGPEQTPRDTRMALTCADMGLQSLDAGASHAVAGSGQRTTPREDSEQARGGVSSNSLSTLSGMDANHAKRVAAATQGGGATTTSVPNTHRTSAGSGSVCTIELLFKHQAPPHPMHPTTALHEFDPASMGPSLGGSEGRDLKQQRGQEEIIGRSGGLIGQHGMRGSLCMGYDHAAATTAARGVEQGPEPRHGSEPASSVVPCKTQGGQEGVLERHASHASSSSTELSNASLGARGAGAPVGAGPVAEAMAGAATGAWAHLQGSRVSMPGADSSNAWLRIGVSCDAACEAPCEAPGNSNNLHCKNRNSHNSHNNNQHSHGQDLLHEAMQQRQRKSSHGYTGSGHAPAAPACNEAADASAAAATAAAAAAAPAGAHSRSVGVAGSDGSAEAAGDVAGLHGGLLQHLRAVSAAQLQGRAYAEGTDAVLLQGGIMRQLQRAGLVGRGGALFSSGAGSGDSGGNGGGNTACSSDDVLLMQHAAARTGGAAASEDCLLPQTAAAGTSAAAGAGLRGDTPDAVQLALSPLLPLTRQQLASAPLEVLCALSAGGIGMPALSAAAAHQLHAADQLHVLRQIAAAQQLHATEKPQSLHQIGQISQIGQIGQIGHQISAPGYSGVLATLPTRSDGGLSISHLLGAAGMGGGGLGAGAVSNGSLTASLAYQHGLSSSLCAHGLTGGLGSTGLGTGGGSLGGAGSLSASGLASSLAAHGLSGGGGLISLPTGRGACLSQLGVLSSSGPGGLQLLSQDPSALLSHDASTLLSHMLASSGGSGGAGASAQQLVLAYQLQGGSVGGGVGQAVAAGGRHELGPRQVLVLHTL